MAIFKIDNKIGNLTIINQVEDYVCNNHSIRQFLCKCDCGTEEIFNSNLLHKYDRQNESYCDECYYKKHNKYRQQINEYTEIFCYNGFEGTLKEICEHLDIKYNTVKMRYWSGERNLDKLFAKPRVNKVFIYNGIKGSIQHICNVLGFDDKDYAYIKNHMAKFNKSLEESIKDLKNLRNNPKIPQKQFYYNNFTGTLKDIYEKFNKHKDLTYSRFVQRTREGMSIEDAINIVPKGKQLYEYKGEKLYLKNICKKLNKSPQIVGKRIREGMSLEEALNYEKRKKADKFTYKGETKTLNQLAIQYHTSTDRLKRCIKEGMSIDEAIKSKGFNKKYSYKGFGTKPEICKHFNIKYGTVGSMMSYKKINFEKAMDILLNRGIKPMNQKYIYRDFEGTITEIIDKFNLQTNYTTVRTRINQGLSIEDCFIETKKHKIYTYNGFTGNLTQIAKKFTNTGAQTLKERMDKGMSLEEAISFGNTRTNIYKVKYNGILDTAENHCRNLNLSYEKYNELKKSDIYKKMSFQNLVDKHIL